jgi:hypothetical protein
VRSRVHECLAPCPAQLPQRQTMMLTVAFIVIVATLFVTHLIVQVHAWV